MTIETNNIHEIDTVELYKNFSHYFIDHYRYYFVFTEQNNIIPYLKNPTKIVLNHLNELQGFYICIIGNGKYIYDTERYQNNNTNLEFLLNILEDYYDIVNDIGYKKRKLNNKSLKLKEFFSSKTAFSFFGLQEELEKGKNIVDSILSSLGIPYEKELFTLKNLELIKKYFHHIYLGKYDTRDEKIYYRIYGYILGVILVSNFVQNPKEEAKFSLNIDLFFIYTFGFFNHILYCTKNMISNSEIIEEFIAIKKFESTLPSFIDKKNIPIFIKSFLYKNIYLSEGFVGDEKLYIYLQNSDLFIANKNIPYKETFELIQSIQDKEILAKIGVFLQERKGMKIRDNILKVLIENIIKTQRIFSYSVLSLGIKYIEGGFQIDEVLGLGEELLKKVQNYSGNKTVLLQELIKNPFYLEQKEKQDYIESIKKDLVYISDDDEGKNAILDLLDDAHSKSGDDLKIEILSLKIKYNIDEKVLFAKKIFKNSLENLAFKLDVLDQFETTGAKEFSSKAEIYEYIFSLAEADITYLVVVIKHLQLPKNISYKAFLELSDILLKKRKFVAQIIHGKELITLDELRQELESKKMFQKINTTFQSILSRELYDMLRVVLKLDTRDYIDEKTLLVLDIFKILDQRFYEDFVLHLDYFSLEGCKNIYDFVQLSKYYDFSIHSFSEYLIAQKSAAHIETCKKMIHNSLLEKVSHKQAFQSEVMYFIKTGDFTRFQEYLGSLENEKKENTLSRGNHEIDTYIFDIYHDGTQEQKEFLVRKLQIFLRNIIDIMHPSQTTSTCNAGFGKGSGSYSEVLGNKIFKKLPKGSQETDDEYLKRIVSLNFHALLEVENISDINHGYHELKCLYITSLNTRDFYPLITFLYDMEKIMGELVGESYTHLSELRKYYLVNLEKELRKLKRSLGL